MDAAYLKQHVGPALAAGLSQVVVKNPSDAIDFLGNFLIQFARDGADAAAAPARQRAAEQILGEEAAQRDSAEKASKDRAEALSSQAADDDALFGELADAEKRFAGPEDGVVNARLGPELRAQTAAVVQKVVDYVKSRTGAEACYLSSLRSMPEGAGEGGQYLAFTTTSRESAFLKKMALRAPEGDAEEPAPESGVTFDLFAPEEEPEPPEVPEGEDPETWVPPVVYRPPPTVVVPNVLRDDRVKYFRFPRMGGYVASRVKFNNSVHDGALVEEQLTADPYPEPVEAGEEGGEEAAAAAAAAEEEAAGGEAEAEAADPEAEAEAAAAPKKELRVWDAATQEATNVLAVDTMGAGRPFTQEEIAFVQRAADALGGFLEKMTKHQYQAEVALHRARLAANAAAAAGAEERAAADASALEAAMSGAPAAVVGALAACLGMAGMDAAAATDPTTKAVTWELLSQTADVDACIAALTAMDGAAFGAEKTAALREAMGGVDGDGAAGFSYAVGALVKACGSVLDNCEATEVIRAAEEAARIEAEEAAAAAAAAAAEEEAGGEDE
jgi:hypothetical protein